MEDPSTAEYRIMPRAAIDTGWIDLVVPLENMEKALSKVLKKGKTNEWQKKSR